MTITNRSFKQIIVVFWALWWTIAFLTDVSGGLKHLQLINFSWALDLNYPALVKALEIYSEPLWLSTFFFVGIVCWSGLSAILFWIASFTNPSRHSAWLRRTQNAFIVSLCFWLVFFIADQAIMNFSLEENHMVQGGFELLCYLAAVVLTDHSHKLTNTKSQTP